MRLLANGTFELIRPRFGDGVDDLTGRPSQFCAERSALDIEISDVEFVRICVADPEITEGRVGQAGAVEQEQILLPSAAGNRRESGARRHAGRELEQALVRAPDRQAIDRFRVVVEVDFSRFHIDCWRCCADGDRFGNGRSQFQVDRFGFVDLHRHSHARGAHSGKRR